MLREQESTCNREQMVTTGDRAGPEAGSQLEISMVFIFIFPYVPIGITTDENPKTEGALFRLVTFWLDVDLCLHGTTVPTISPTFQAYKTSLCRGMCFASDASVIAFEARGRGNYT